MAGAGRRAGVIIAGDRGCRGAFPVCPDI